MECEIWLRIKLFYLKKGKKKRWKPYWEEIGLILIIQKEKAK